MTLVRAVALVLRRRGRHVCSPHRILRHTPAVTLYGDAARRRPGRHREGPTRA